LTQDICLGTADFSLTERPQGMPLAAIKVLGLVSLDLNIEWFLVYF
jgi:hypothetical protein